MNKVNSESNTSNTEASGEAVVAGQNIGNSLTKRSITRRSINKLRLSKKPMSVRPKRSLAKLKSLRPKFSTDKPELEG